MQTVHGTTIRSTKGEVMQPGSITIVLTGRGGMGQLEPYLYSFTASDGTFRAIGQPLKAHQG